MEAYLYDLDDINSRLKENPNDTTALDALQEIVDEDVYPLKLQGVLASGGDGVVYNTDIESIVIKKSPDTDFEVQFKDLTRKNQGFARILGANGDYLIEQKIFGSEDSLLSRTLKDYDNIITLEEFHDLFRILCFYLREIFEYNHRDLHSGNIILFDRFPAGQKSDTKRSDFRFVPKIIDLSFSCLWGKIESKRGRGLPDFYVPLLDVYRVLVRTCFVNKFDSPLLEFFDLTLSELKYTEKWLIPKKYYKRTWADFWSYLNFIFVNQNVPVSVHLVYRAILENNIAPIKKFSIEERRDLIPPEILEQEKKSQEIENLNVLTSEYLTVNELVLYRNAGDLEDYTRFYDQIINFELRRGGPISIFTSKILNGILGVLEELAPIEQEYKLYRGIKNFDPFKNSEVFFDPGFSSKTSNKEVAYSFSMKNIILEIKYPQGTKQIYMDPISFSPDEEEYLSYPGEKIRLISKKKTKQGLIYYCEYVDNEFKYPETDEKIDEGIEVIIKPILEIIYQNRIETFFTQSQDPRNLWDEQNMSEIGKRNLYRYLFTNTMTGKIKRIRVNDQIFNLY